MKTILANCLVLALAGVGLGCASQQGSNPSMSAVSNEEEVLTAPTVLVHDQADGTFVNESIGTKSFNETTLWTISNFHLSSVQVADNGSLRGFSITDVAPELVITPGDHFAEELHFDLSGKLVAIIPSRTEAPPDCEVHYTTIGGTIYVTCRDNSCPYICHLTKTVIDPHTVSYSCDCPANP